LPGGYLGLHLGLIAVVSSRDELASVLAHELSHVTQRHISRLITKQNAQTPWVIGAMILGAWRPARTPTANALMAGGQAVAMQNQLNFSRDMEREADRVGFGGDGQAGFAPQGFVACSTSCSRPRGSTTTVRFRTCAATPDHRAHRRHAGAPAAGGGAASVARAVVRPCHGQRAGAGAVQPGPWMRCAARVAEARGVASLAALPRRARPARCTAPRWRLKLRDTSGCPGHVGWPCCRAQADAAAARLARLLEAEMALAGRPRARSACCRRSGPTGCAAQYPEPGC
jgi:hypothetical protein